MVLTAEEKSSAAFPDVDMQQNTGLKSVELYDAAQSARRNYSNQSHLKDLVEVLSERPAGLRRWSVMRVIRSRWELDGREVSQKFEDEVERTFRNHCAVDALPGRQEQDNGSALFYRPKERAGEVWAVIPERAKAWLRDCRDEPV